MSSEESVIRFLTDLGVLDDDDLDAVRKMQGETIVAAMVRRKALAPHEQEEAQGLISELMECSNETKRMKAKMSLLKIVTSNIHKRMASSCDRMREHKERITSGHFPAVALATKAPGEG